MTVVFSVLKGSGKFKLRVLLVTVGCNSPHLKVLEMAFFGSQTCITANKDFGRCTSEFLLVK
jgi:hypothetical protein